MVTSDDRTRLANKFAEYPGEDGALFRAYHYVEGKDGLVERLLVIPVDSVAFLI
jgi:hypothetical protein